MTNPLRTTIRRELRLARPRRHGRTLCLGAVAVLLWSLQAGSARAQAPYQQELLPGFSSFDVGERAVPAFVDLDGDGDFDAVVGQDGGSLRFFENTGSSTTAAFIERTGSLDPVAGITAGINSSPDLVDLDGDGDLDAVVGEGGGEVLYFENTGSSSSASFVERTGGANPFAAIDVGYDSAPELVDLDADGDLDAVIGAQAGTVRYFLNTGSSTVPAFLEDTASPFFSIDVGVLSQPELVDLDADLDLDAVIGESEGNLRYYENTGSSTAPAFVLRSGTASPFNGIGVGRFSAPALADLDADGDLDLLPGEYYGGLRDFVNTGTSSDPAFVPSTGTASLFHGIDAGSFSSPELVDLDADGDLDVVIGELSGTFLYFANTGSATDPAFLERTGTANPLGGFDVGSQSNATFADIDGDGDLDAFAGESDGVMTLLANTGTSTGPAFIERSGFDNPLFGFDVGFNSQPALVDLDGDGDFDVVAGEADGILNYFENTGSSMTPAYLGRTGTANPFLGFDVGSRSIPAFADLDRDGDLDVLVGEISGTFSYLENTGTSTAPAFLERTGTANPFLGNDIGRHSSPALADLDADGDLDALSGEIGGQLVFYRSQFAGALLFADGFESGGTSAWSAISP